MKTKLWKVILVFLFVYLISLFLEFVYVKNFVNKTMERIKYLEAEKDRISSEIDKKDKEIREYKVEIERLKMRIESIKFIPKQYKGGVDELAEEFRKRGF